MEGSAGRPPSFPMSARTNPAVQSPKVHKQTQTMKNNQNRTNNEKEKQKHEAKVAVLEAEKQRLQHQLSSANGRVNPSARKVAKRFAKSALGPAYNKRTWQAMLSPSMRAYLAVLTNPFEVANMKKTAGVPVSPAVPSRKYSCFARGTFSTCPRDTTASAWTALNVVTQNALLDMTESNVGWIMISPKLFGLDTSSTVYSRARFEGRYENMQNITAPDGAWDPVATGTLTLPMNYTLMQQPVVYTSFNSPFGAPAQLMEVNPVLQGERLPVVMFETEPGYEDLPAGYLAPGIGLFNVPSTSTTPHTPASTIGLPQLLQNVSRAGSNSDVPWYDVLPPDPFVGTSASWRFTTTNPVLPDASPSDSDDQNILVSFSGSSRLQTRKIRLVSIGLRIKYIGTEINRGGQVIGLREPGGFNMAAGAFGGVTCTSNDATTTVPSYSPGEALPLITRILSSSALPDGATGYELPQTYEVLPGFRSADWRLFGADPPGPFGLAYPSSNAGNGNIPSFTGMPFDKLVNPNDTFGFDQLASYDQGIPGDVERPWDELVYYPIDPTSMKYEYLYETVTTTQSQRMGIASPGAFFIESTAAQTSSVSASSSMSNHAHTRAANAHSFRLGHFKLNGRAMSATQACHELTRRFTDQLTATKDPLLAKKLRTCHRSITNKLGDPELLTELNLPVTNNGGISVNLGVSRADNDWGYSMAWIVRGADDTTPARFQFEVCGHYELIGKDIRGQTAGAAPDPTGIAAMHALGPQLTVATTTDGNTRRKRSLASATNQVATAVAQQSGAKPPIGNGALNTVDGVLNAVKQATSPDTLSGIADTVSGAVDTASTVMDIVGDVAEFFAALF